MYIVASGPELADSPQSDCCRSSVFHTAKAKPLASQPTTEMHISHVDRPPSSSDAMCVAAMPVQKRCTQIAASLSTEATSAQGYLLWRTAMCTASAGRTASALTQVDGRSVHSEFLTALQRFRIFPGFAINFQVKPTHVFFFSRHFRIMQRKKHRKRPTKSREIALSLKLHPLFYLHGRTRIPKLRHSGSVRPPDNFIP